MKFLISSLLKIAQNADSLSIWGLYRPKRGSKILFGLIKNSFKYPLIYIVGVIFILTLFLSVIIAFFPRKNLHSEIENVNTEKKITKKSLLITFISGCLITPYLETLLFQFSVIRLVQLIFNDLNQMTLISIIVSTVLFSLAHFIGRSFFDVFTRIPLGIALAIVYIISDFREMHPIVITYLFHFAWNCLFVIVLPILVVKLEKE